MGWTPGKEAIGKPLHAAFEGEPRAVSRHPLHEPHLTAVGSFLYCCTVLGLSRILIVAALLLACLTCVAFSLILPPDVASDRPATEEPKAREALGHTMRQERENFQRPRFAPSGHFFNGPVRVTISSPAGAKTYYTTDGSTPTDKSRLYTSPITLGPEEGRPCVVLKAVAVADGKAGAVGTHSYFFDAGILDRRPAYVFSLSTDDGNLYDFEKGILTPGRRRAESERLHPERVEDAHDANFKARGRDWERPVDVEIFTGDGAPLLSQKAGLRVIGGISRTYPQKSVRLVARKFYEPENGRFRHSFFPEQARDDARFPVRTFKNLILRNGGQELKFSQIRDPLLTRIALRAGYHWTAPVNTAAVYLNGRYYGFAWLTARLDANLLGQFFDRPSADFVILAGGVDAVRSSPRYPYLLHWRLIREFNAALARCGQGDMDDALYDDIRSLVDVENFLLYNAIQVYVDNWDWPGDGNNSRVWRHVGMDGAFTPELDGRWRYILYDLDATAMSPWKDHVSDSVPTLGRVFLMSRLLRSLMSRPDCVVQFANNLCDMAFVHYSEANVRKTMEELDASSLAEIRYAALHGPYSPPDRLETLERGRGDVLRFFRNRPDRMLEEMRQNFGFTGLYHVKVEGMARLNTIGPDNPEGWYFVENPVTVVSALPPGRVLLHWEVNGQPREGERLTLFGTDAVNGEIAVRLVSGDAPIPLVIENAYDRDGVCGFSLRNVTTAPVGTAGLFVSDNPGKPRKYALPDMLLAPGETLQLVGKGVRHARALGKMRLNFNPRWGETVCLRDGEGRMLSSMVVGQGALEHHD